MASLLNSLLSRKHNTLIMGKLGRFPFSQRYRVHPKVRSSHMYVVGKTGKGKSRFLQHCILSDIKQGNGVGVIDPHGDLITQTIETLYSQDFFTTSDAQKLIYINPVGRDYITPFNVLSTPHNPTREQIHAISRHVITTFKRAWKDVLSAAPNFEDTMENALILLIKTQRTLIELPRLFTHNTAFRDHLLDQTDDPKIAEFFRERMSHRSAPERVESTLNKVNPLRNNPHLELMLGQRENWIDFRRFMDEGYTVLINLAHCDETSQELFGNFFTHGFEQAAFSRDNIPPPQRRPFYLYIDEFQDFSATSGKAFSRILSGARKYGLSLTLANQYLGQLGRAELLEAVFGNVATKIFFGVSELDALRLAPAMGLGYIDPEVVKHEAQTETQHPIYQSIPEQQGILAAELANQATAQAIVRNHKGQKLKIYTMPVPDTTPIPDKIFKTLIPAFGIPHSKAIANLKQHNEPTFQLSEDFIHPL